MFTFQQIFEQVSLKTAKPTFEEFTMKVNKGMIVKFRLRLRGLKQKPVGC